MLSKTILLTLATMGMVSAHGRVDVVTGDAGGNGTALGIQGASVPLTGRNSKTEVDTTVFKRTKVATDGLGKTTDTGNIDMSLMKNAMAMSGSTLPQVNSSLSGTWHVVTSDGFGSVKAVLDPTATGEFSKGIQLETTTDVPGNKGNEPKDFAETNDKAASSGFGSIFRRLAERSGVVQKRAHNINADYPMAFAVPAGTTCSGSMMGMENVCLVKIANENNAGPFGGVVAIQMASASSASGDSANVTAKARSFRA